MKKITIRKFPYPYQAALSICSDIDGTSWKNFLIIHQFLNSNQKTILGQGLSLPIADSFWMYDKPEIVNSAFSYFKNVEGEESENAPIIRDFIRAGLIDVMHSYGNFAYATEFSRKLATQALEELNRHNLKLKVWTNHGGIENTQNIGALSFGKGDNPVQSQQLAAPNFYHSDLLLDYGIQFYWDSEASVTGIVGQDTSIKFGDAFWRSPLYSGFKLKSKSILKGMISLADELYFKIHKRHFIPWQPFDAQNEVIQMDKLRDSSQIYKFKRFGNGRFDWSENFSYLLNDSVLEHLIEKHGYLILYIHLGDREQKASNKPLSETTVNKFCQLAELFNSGVLWVETTSRLLNYNRTYHSLDWQVSETESAYNISINGLKDNLKENDLSVDDLQGISFILPRDKQARIFLKNREISIKTHIAKNQQIAMIPLTPIEWHL